MPNKAKASPIAVMEEGDPNTSPNGTGGIPVETTHMNREALWESVPTPWKIIFKKNLIFQSELVVEQQSQSKFAARYYDMDTYWQVFFPKREVDLSITEEEYLQLLALKRLKCGGTKVDSLSILPKLGLECLEYLDCNHTNIDSLQALTNFDNLRTVELEYTAVSDLSPLRSCADLSQLYFSSTNVIDIGVLADLPRLTNIDLNDTKVDDISALGCLPNLETLVMNGCANVKDLTPLGNSRALVKLDISGTGITSLASLSNHRNLQILVAGGLDIDTIEAVSAIPSLESLYINNARNVIDLECLRHSKSLKALYISGVTVTGVEALLDIDSLTILFHSNLPQSFCDHLGYVNPDCSITRQ
jgi:Leucine Rich repeats (2 copies)